MRAELRPGCWGLSLRARGPQHLSQRLAVSDSSYFQRSELRDSGCSGSAFLTGWREATES